MKRNWFVATIILKCEVAGAPTAVGEWTCIQQIHLLRAPDRETAYEKAIALGQSQASMYLNSQTQLVTWTFVGLENLEELADKTIRDGSEVWGRVFSTHSPQALVVEKEGLSVFYDDAVRDRMAEELLVDGIATRLVCNRVRVDEA